MFISEIEAYRVSYHELSSSNEAKKETLKFFWLTNIII